LDHELGLFYKGKEKRKRKKLRLDFNWEGRWGLHIEKKKKKNERTNERVCHTFTLLLASCSPSLSLLPAILSISSMKMVEGAW
jgi:hypothetical protein